MELLKSSLEKKFELFFTKMEAKNFTNSEIINILEPLTKINYKKKQEPPQQRNFKEKLLWKNIFIVVILLTLLYILIKKYYNERYLIALGRIFIIQLLPYWNWTQLHNRECLIEWNNYEILSQYETSIATDYEITLTDNCLLCKFIDDTPFIVNTTFSNIQHSYLNRGLPAIVRDSHITQNFHDITKKIYTNAPELLEYLPCDIWTNLILRKFFHLELAIKIIQNNLITNSTMEKWFLQFRNCQFDAIKLSRAFIMKPYFYPKHLQPFYSSWLLLSQNYQDDMYHFVIVQGLIIIQQYSGNIGVLLKPKYPCPEYNCKSLEMLLRAGESLIFTTDLWSLKYKFLLQPTITIITTIIEIEMN